MAAEKGLLVRSGAYLGATVAQLAGTFALLPFLTRALSADQYGSVVLVLVVGQVLTFVVAAGMPVAILRTYLDRDQEKLLAGRVAGASILVSAGISVILVVGIPLWGPAVAVGSEARRLLPFAVLLGWTQGALEIGLALLRAAERPRPFVLASLIRSLVGPLLGLVAVLTYRDSAAGYLAGLGVAAGLAAVVALQRGGARPPDAAAWQQLRTELPVALPAVPHALGMMALAVGDRLVIERVLGSEEAGRYHVAYLLGTLGIVATQAINNAWAPLVVGASERSRWALHRKVTSTVVAALGATSAAAALAAPAMLAIAVPAGPWSSELAIVAGLVASGAALFGLYASAGHVLTAIGWTAPLMVVTPVVATINLLVNLLAVPRWGLVGAAVTTVVSYGLLACGAVVVAGRRSPMAWPWRLAMVWVVVVVGIVTVGGQVPDSPAWLVVRGVGAVALVAGVGAQIVRAHGIAAWFSPAGATPVDPVASVADKRT